MKPSATVSHSPHARSQQSTAHSLFTVQEALLYARLAQSCEQLCDGKQVRSHSLHDQLTWSCCTAAQLTTKSTPSAPFVRAQLLRLLLGQAHSPRFPAFTISLCHPRVGLCEPHPAGP